MTDSPFSSRRLFLQQLAVAGILIPGWENTVTASQSADISTAGLADIGTLYSQIAELAAGNSYPLSFLSKEQPDAASYRRTAREKVLELFHYEPPPVDPNPEVV